MGLACGTICSRERNNDNNPDNPEFAQQTTLVLKDHLLQKEPLWQIDVLLKPVTKFDNIVTSASNYWTNRQKFNVNGNRRPIVTYNIDSRNQLIKIHNSVFTKQELTAVIKIQRWWLKSYRRRISTVNRSYTKK